MPADDFVKRFKDALLPARVRVRELVESLPLRKQIAVALCCCERLYPAFRAFVESSSREDCLRPILDRLWEHVKTNNLTIEDIEIQLNACENDNLLSETCEKDWNAFQAICCVGSTIRAVQKDTSNNVLLACEECLEAVHQKLWKKYGPGPGGIVTPEENFEIQARIDSDPLMVREAEIQSSQLDLLISEQELTDEIIARLLSLNKKEA